MREKTAAALLSAGLVMGGGVALVAPGASAADSTTGTSVTDRAASRITAIKDALKGLVSDGTITQKQADKVASTLAQSDLGGRGGHGPHGGRVSPEATAKAIGITVDQLWTARRNGSTLTQIAKAHGVSRATLISRLVAAARTQLDADVKAGRLTSAQADSIRSTLTQRVTEEVDEVHGPGHGRGGFGGHGGPGGPGDGDGPGDGPAPAPSPSGSASTSGTSATSA